MKTTAKFSCQNGLSNYSQRGEKCLRNTQIWNSRIYKHSEINITRTHKTFYADILYLW